MDPASTTYRVHQCSKCLGDTKYFCVSCISELCPQCKENHGKHLNTLDNNVMMYRWKFKFNETAKKSSIPDSINQCSRFLGDKDYFYVTDLFDLRPRGKVNHLKYLKTIDHNEIIHSKKIHYISTPENCVSHPSNVYNKYCEPCQVPVCDCCSGHIFSNSFFRKRRHNIISLQEAYKTNRHQIREIIHTIRSQTLFYRPLLLTRIKADFKTCRTEFSLYQSDMLTKAQTLKDLIDNMLYDILNTIFCDFDFKHRCLKQELEINRHIVSLQKYVHINEQSATNPLQFLSSIKTALPQIHLTLHTRQLSMTKSLNKKDVMESLSAIQITERGNRRVGNQCLLKLMSSPEFHQSLTLSGVSCCYHISCVNPYLVWVSDDDNNLLSINTTGATRHRLGDTYSDIIAGNGVHTMTSESALIYIDKNYNIKKRSKNMKIITILTKKTFSKWRPLCVHWSPSTGDLLVGMNREDTETCKINRYNQSGQLTKTIQPDNTGLAFCRLPLKPGYITENNNGDVVVSYCSYIYGEVVVTERGGKHRFCYTGHPSGSGLQPRGICTDALSHILVCDDRTKTVHLLNKDGQFLSKLLVGIPSPHSLSYEVNTHRLWVGSWDSNKVVVYRYIDRQDAPRFGYHLDSIDFNRFKCKMLPTK